MRNTPAGQQLAGFMRQAGGALESVKTTSASGSALTIDARLGNVQDITLTANCTFTLASPAKGYAATLTLVLRQDGTGSRTVTWPGSVTWLAGTAPTLKTAASAIDIVALTTVDGGTTWIGDYRTGPVKVFDSTLGVAAASIDTGAGGIPAGYDTLEIHLYGRTDEAVVASAVNMTVNNDSGSNYDRQRVRGSNATASAGLSNADTKFQVVVAGSSAGTSIFGTARVVFPNYAGTVGNKTGDCIGSFPDSSTSALIDVWGLGWRSTNAISQITVAPATAGKKLIAGSRLTIWVR